MPTKTATYLARLRDLDVTYYVSGANSPGDILGFARTGHDVGATITEFVQAAGWAGRQRTEEALAGLVGTKTQVFLDSGAFREVNRNLEVIRPISREAWDERLATYERLALTLGGQLSVVAPDRLGSQSVTLTRQAEHRARLQTIYYYGAHILVPLPVGRRSLADQFLASAEALELPANELVPAIPTVKGPVELEDIVEFVREVQPRRIHLLGLSPLGSAFGPYIEAIREVDPDITISCDAARMPAISGYIGGNRDKPRVYTAVGVPRARGELVESMWGDVVVAGLDYTDLVGEPSLWMTAAARERLAQGLQLAGRDKRAVVSGDIDSWLSDNRNDWVDQEVDREWGSFLLGRSAAATTDWLHQRGLEVALGPRILVLTSCTATKADVTETEAERLYTGRQHLRLMEGVDAARNAGLTVDVWIVSAGLGLIHGGDWCSPYNETFSGLPATEIRRRGMELGLPGDVRGLLETDYDLGMILLGRDYLQAVGLSPETELGGLLLAPVGASRSHLPDLPGLAPVVLDDATIRRYGGQIAAKGAWAARTLVRLASRADEFLRGE